MSTHSLRFSPEDTAPQEVKTSGMHLLPMKVTGQAFPTPMHSLNYFMCGTDRGNFCLKMKSTLFQKMT